MIEENKFLRQARLRLVRQTRSVADFEAALADAHARGMSATIVAVSANLSRARTALAMTRGIIAEYAQGDLPLKVKK